MSSTTRGPAVILFRCPVVLPFPFNTLWSSRDCGRFYQHGVKTSADRNTRSLFYSITQSLNRSIPHARAFAFLPSSPSILKRQSPVNPNLHSRFVLVRKLAFIFTLSFLQCVSSTPTLSGCDFSFYSVHSLPLALIIPFHTLQSRTGPDFSLVYSCDVE